MLRESVLGPRVQLEVAAQWEQADIEAVEAETAKLALIGIHAEIGRLHNVDQSFYVALMTTEERDRLMAQDRTNNPRGQLKPKLSWGAVCTLPSYSQGRSRQDALESALRAAENTPETLPK